MTDDLNRIPEDPEFEDDEVFEDDDLVECVDEDGNKVLMQVLHSFFYNGDEYSVLVDAEDTEDCCKCEECAAEALTEDPEEVDLYIMKVTVTQDESGQEIEEFSPVEDEALLDKLIEIARANFQDDYNDEDDEEDDVFIDEEE
ncbi:MAG: DUF1292 domain-containing protein [Clostridia bacterium]|nr:DUF1292 domain-containing protein [Clostridia bacterium]